MENFEQPTFQPKPFVLVMFKPQGLEVRESVMDILSRNGRVVDQSRVTVTEDKLQAHYDPSQPYYAPLSKYLRGVNTEVLIVEGDEADFVQRMRKLNGARSPIHTEEGQIRNIALKRGMPFIQVIPTQTGNQYCYDNLIHMSDSLESATREIGIWFDEETAQKYKNYLHFLSKEQ